MPHQRPTTRLWVFFFALSVLTLGLFGQAGRGKGFLSGTVVDETNKIMVGIEVTVEFPGALKDSIKTNAKGEWSFIGLGTGSARIIASADGYIPAVANVTVRQLERNPPITLQLKIDLEKKARLDDESSLAILDKGNQLYSAKQYDEALAIYNEFITQNPKVYQIYFNIGDCYRDKGDIEAAIKTYDLGREKAAENNDVPVQAKALAAIGEIHLRQNHMPKAQEYFRKSLELNPKDEVLAYNVAEIFFGNNNTDGAIEYYKLAVQIKPAWSAPYIKLGYAYLNKDDFESAIKNFEEFLRIDPENSQAPVVQNILNSLPKTKK